MKKYVASLAMLFVMQNTQTMDPFALSLENDKKCQLVARYVYKYPSGKNRYEAQSTRSFLADTGSERAVLSQDVNKYINRLKNKDAEEWLRCMHKENLPPEIKQKIFTYALWSYAAQYYAVYNACKFVAIDKDRQLNPYYCPGFIDQKYIPYFFAEVHELDRAELYFSDKGDDEQMYPLADSLVETICFIPFMHFRMTYKLKRNILRKLVSFLDIKELRVENFKLLFRDSIDNLSSVKVTKGEVDKITDKDLSNANIETGIDEFIEFLSRLKGLTKVAARMYESETNRSWFHMLEGYPRFLFI